jgi:hypothetical protein
MIDKKKILEKSECMTLLCTRTSSHWSLIKFIFNIPLVFTSSAMCIINSISTDANEVKIPNIVVNAVSVLIMSLSNSIKASEKLDLFHRLSIAFMQLSCEIENCNDDVSVDDLKLLNNKYENLVTQCLFEEIPDYVKQKVINTFEFKHKPIQLNGLSGLSCSPSIKLNSDLSFKV